MKGDRGHSDALDAIEAQEEFDRSYGHARWWRD
jgi:hypothetical protein